MSGSQHPSWQEELMAYADGELQADHAQRVAVHLQNCSECAQAVAEAKKLSTQMTAWQVEEAPDRLAESVIAELQKTVGQRRESPSASGWWTRGRVWAYGLSGSFAALVLVAFALTPSLLRSRQAPSVSVVEYKASAPDTAMISELQFDQGKTEGQQGQQAQQGQGQGQGQSLQRRLQETTRVSPEEPAGPMVIRTIRLTLITREFETARAKIEATVRESRGYVDQMSVKANPGAAKSLVAVLRFPSDRLDAGLTELRKLGRAKEESQSTSDVTGQYTDLAARLANARNTEQRMLALQRERTGKLPDVVEVEREISRIREHIERMEAEQKNLNNKVQYATVHVDLTEEYRAQLLEPSAPSAGTRLRNAAVEGYEYAVEAVLGIALAALMYGPTLVLWGVLLSSLAFVAWRLHARILSRYL
jgi:hypothetical protein